MLYTRRDVGKVALATLPTIRAFGAAKFNSKFGGVQIGAISYSFNPISRPDPAIVIQSMIDLELSEIELTLDHCEALAGLPVVSARFGGGGGAAAGAARGGRAPMTPEQQAARAEAQAKITAWRAAATPATWAPVRKKFNDAGIEVAVVSGEMNDRMTDQDIEYQISIAEGMRVKALNTSTTLTMAKRIAPIADKHKMRIGYHGHDQTNDPNQTATLESYDTLMAYGKYNGVNLDVGHFTAANYDAVAFIEKHHDKITSLHLKDRKKNHGPTVPWGTGDTPLKEILLLIKKNKYPIPGNIEWEGVPTPEGSTLVGEMKKCVALCKQWLA
jgi:sugar phosphate isomerase/epimerase